MWTPNYSWARRIRRKTFGYAFLFKEIFSFSVAFGWTLLKLKSSKSCRRILDFPEISEISPTLRSCISELNEYFFKIRKDPERSMSELSYEPNTVKNGHLVQKLEPLKDRRFSENSLSHPHSQSVATFLWIYVFFKDFRRCARKSYVWCIIYYSNNV